MRKLSIKSAIVILVLGFSLFLFYGYQSTGDDQRNLKTPFIGNQLYADDQDDEPKALPMQHRVEKMPTKLKQRIRTLRGVEPKFTTKKRPSSTQMALAEIAEMRPNQMVELIIKLKDPGFDFTRFEEAAPVEINALIKERKAQLRPGQRRIIDRLRKSGAKTINRFWITNQLAVQVPVKMVRAISQLDYVEGIAIDDNLVMVPDEGYGGGEARNGILTNAFIDENYFGATGGRCGGKIRVGIIESYDHNNSWLLYDHYGFQDANGNSRLINNYYCTQDSCLVVDSLGIDNHGSRVTYIAAGSIEDGQDPNPAFTTEDKQRRSGIAPKSDIYYYAADGAHGFVSATEQALIDGIDVLNYSASWQKDCSVAISYDKKGINEAMKNAVDAGIFFAKGAGNNNHSADTCSLWYPGWRSDAFICSSLKTSPNGKDYKTTDLLNSAPRGGIEMTTEDGEIKIWAGIDMVLPASFSYYYTFSPDGYETTTTRQGSSFAGPVAAGSAGLIREIWTDKGWKASNARLIHANMLAMGDTWDATTDSTSTSEMSVLSGAGRLRAYRPDSKSLKAPWGWGQRGITIHQDSTYSFITGKLPKSNSVEQWKWAIMWSEPDYSAVADIVIMVVDTCPTNGAASEELIAYDCSGGLRKRISLDAAEIGGRCLEFRIIGVNVPEGGRKVYSADFYHSGTPD